MHAGSGEDTIQFVESNNSATLTMQFYKCADAENCLILPRKWCWFHIKGASSNTATANTDEVNSVPASFSYLTSAVLCLRRPSRGAASNILNVFLAYAVMLGVSGTRNGFSYSFPLLVLPPSPTHKSTYIVTIKLLL